ncbi:MAG: HYR domain-containing protein [Bacteroidetes bacterium]|nr:HYR domain-containing protein [Bacteroidota bacterium]
MKRFLTLLRTENFCFCIKMLFFVLGALAPSVVQAGGPLLGKNNRPEAFSHWLPFVQNANGVYTLAASITVTESSGTANNDGIICNGATVTLEANTGDSYNWSTGANTKSISVSPAANTTYTVTVTTGGTPMTASTTITVNALPTPSTSVSENSGTANNDGIICVGASVGITASGGSSYSWNTGSNTATINVSPASTTTYTVTVTNSNGCTATANRTITVNALPVPTVSIAETSGNNNNDGTICLGASVTLTAGGGNSYNWSTGSNNASTTVSPSVTTTYTVTVTNSNGCSKTTTTTITVATPSQVPDQTYCRNAAPVNLLTLAPLGLTFSGPGVVGTIFTPSSVDNSVSDLQIKVTYECNLPGTNSNMANINVHLNPSPVATLKDVLADCVAPGQQINLQSMFNGATSGGTFTISPSLTITNTSISAPASGGCFSVTYTAPNPNNCPGSPFTSTKNLMITTKPNPQFTISGPGGATICQVGGNISFTVNQSSNGPNQVLKVNGVTKPIGTAFSLPAPGMAGTSITYTFTLTETNNTPTACGTLPGNPYTPCTGTTTKIITVYNDGLCGTTDIPFQSECDANIDDPVFDVCPVSTSPYFQAGCAFINVTISYPIVEAQLTSTKDLIFCSTPNFQVNYQGRNVFNSIPGFNTKLGDMTGLDVICDVLNFCICIGFLDIEWHPLGALGAWCNKSLADLVSDAIAGLTNSGGYGGIVVADSDGDGAFDEILADYDGFPQNQTAIVPNNMSKQAGIITVRHVAGWPFKADQVCGAATVESFNLLDALSPFIDAIPIAGPIISAILTGLSCDIPLAFTNSTDVQVPVINDVPPVFVNCPSQYVFSEDLACSTTADWSIPVAQDGCIGGNLVYKGRTAGTSTTYFSGTPTPVLTVASNGSGVYQTGGPVSGSNLPTGNHTVTYTAYSCRGFSSSCSFVVTVNSGNPLLEVPNNITVATDVDQCQAVVTGLGPVSGVGCATLINYSVTYPAGSGLSNFSTGLPYNSTNKGKHMDVSGLIFPLGTTTVTYILNVDLNNNGTIETNTNESQTKQFTVTVVDLQAPKAVCVDQEVKLDNTGNATVFALNQNNGTPFINGGCTDNCTGPLTIQIQKPGQPYAASVQYNCGEVGANFVNLKVTDAKDNSSTCIARVKVIDYLDGINIQMALPQLCLGSTNPSQLNFANYLSITLANGQVLSHSVGGFNSGPLVGSRGFFAITAFAPSNGSTNDPGTITFDGVYTPGTGSGFVTISYLLLPPGFVMPPGGNVPLSGCFRMGHKVIEIRQPLVMGSPECKCLIDEERVVDLGIIKGGLEPYTIQYSGTRLDVDGDGIPDDADGSYTYSVANGHNINDFQQDLGELRVVYTQPTWSFTVVDARGCELFRSGSCDNDDLLIGPSITCPPSNLTLTTEEYLCESQYDWTHPLPTDNCAVVLYDYRIKNPDGTIEGPFNLNALLNIAPGAPLNQFFDATYEFQLGTSVVTYYAEDAQGNFTSCTFQIKVTDNDPPHFINCPYPPVVQDAETGHCDAYVDFALPLATDNCSIPVVKQIDNTGLSTGSRFPVGTTVMYWEASDPTGNKDTCQVKVIVNDYWQVPQLTCPANVLKNNDTWLCGAYVNNIAPTVAGPCKNNYGITYSIYADAALTVRKDCGVADASGQFFDVGESWVKYTVQSQPLLLITEVTQSGAVDRIEISNLGPAAIDITCLEVKRSSGTPAANQVIGPVSQLPSLAPSILPVGGTRVFNFSFDAAANLPACYTISYMGTIFDEVATNGFAGCNGFTGTLAGGDVIRKCEDDSNKAADWVLAENCYPLTIGAINPDLQVMPNNGTKTSLQSILPSKATCTFKVTIKDAENPFCGKLTSNTTYNGPGIANISAATCNRSTITIPAGNCIIGDIVFNRTGTATPANSTMTLISPKGIKVVLNKIPQDSIAALFAQKAEGTWTLDIVPKPNQTPTLTGWSLTVNCIANFDLANQTLNNAPGQCGQNFTWTHPYFVDNCFNGTISVAYSSNDAACVPTGGQLLGKGGYSTTQFFCVGTTKVTYTLKDAAGNVSTCGFNVTVKDVEKPKVVCPADIFINLNGGECGRYVSYGPVSASDNCMVKDTVMNPPSGSWFAIGDKTVTITVTDKSGNTQTCSFVIHVIEHVPSSSALVCNDLTHVSLDSTCVYVVDADAALEGDDYHCYSDYIIKIKNNVGVVVGNTFNASNIGTTYTVTVLDPETGNSCWTNMKIEDKLAPKLKCPANITIGCSESTQIAHTGNVNIQDCTNTTTVVDDNFTDLGDCGSPRARIVRTFIVTDAWANQSTCSQTITIANFNLNDVVFPADKTVDCETLYGNPNGTKPAFTGAPSINGASILGAVLCNAKVNFTDTYYEGCAGTSTILRQWSVLSDCLPLSANNPVSYTQRIKVVDNGGPVFNCPANVTVSTDPLSCCATAALPDIIVSEGCSHIQNLQAKVTGNNPVNGNIITFTVNGYLGDFPANNYWNPDTLAIFPYTQCLPQGTYNVTYTASDECANTSKCSFKLTVADLVPPVSACDQFTKVALGANGVALVDASTFDDGSKDNCAPVEFKARRMQPNTCQSDTVFYDQVKFCCSDINDTILVVFRVYDVDVPSGEIARDAFEGRFNDCMVQVHVEDKIKPSCTPPANVTVSCENFDPSLWAYGKAVIDDNCCLDPTKSYQSQIGLTHAVNLSQFDTVCNKGTITRTFRAFDCGGNSSQCTQRVFVTYEQDYFVKFPNDVIVSVCDGTGNYGAPTFFGEDCELLGVSFEDEIFTVVPDACFKIERSWTIINWCTFNPNLGCVNVPNPNPNVIVNNPANLPGVTVSPAGTLAPWNPTVVKVNPTDASPTNYSIFYDANANCYKYKQVIKIIDTQDPTAQCPASPVEYCDVTPNDPQLWNEMYWWDNVISSHDLCEGDADLSITATDACSGANVNFRYLLFLDLNGDNVMETVVSSTNLPGVNNVQFDNINTPNYSGGTPRAFDGRPVPQNQKWRFGLDWTTSGTNVTAKVRFDNTQSPIQLPAQGNNVMQGVVPQLPYGNHKIKWFIEDGCGNETICEYTFVVKDCKKPTVVCLNGLSVNIMPTQMIQLWASDFLQYTEDNCTPADQLKIAIRKSSDPTPGFPVDAQGNPITSVTFSCQELGTQLVKLWSIDKAGNADFCETYVIVQDNMGNCPPSAGAAKVAGVLSTENVNGVEDGNVEITGSGNAIPTFTFTQMSDGNGNYNFNAIPLNSNSTVTPTKDDNPLNGVSTYDLVLISKHILGIESLNSPYKMIAADANKSGSITTFDIIELRKLILGIYQELPNNTSWRFVDKSYVFPNASNPFQGQIMESKSIDNITSSMLGQDFVAVKVGDVNGNAIANSAMSSDDRTSGTLLFDVENKSVTAGEIFTVNFAAAEKVAGYQFTMNFKGLEVVDVLPLAKDMKPLNFGVFTNSITTSYDGEEEGAFAVRFRATQSGQIKDLLYLSSCITKAEAYKNGERWNVAFRFNNNGTSTIAGVGFELYQNQPNPFVNKTSIGFHLPEASNATLSIFDETGRVIYNQKANYAKGYNTVTLDRALLNTVGMLYYKLETATDSATKKMIQTR